MYFSSDASVIMLSYNSCVEVSVPSKPSSRLCLSILAWHTGGASSGLVPGAGKCRKYTVEDAGVGEKGQRWAVREGSMEKVSFEMNFEDVMRSQLTQIGRSFPGSRE